jgi:TonB dependent receptor/TonB-dependent Receptor Plug Domain
MNFRTFSLPVFVSLTAIAHGQVVPADVTLEPVTVYGRSLDLVGDATSAAAGQVGSAELAARPFLRRGELLEVVPGVVITQHSGSGKANQYFLRGFNLDHGTDFAVTVDGLPVNMRTHAHGQGYSDLNFIIPELVQSVAYQKGVSFAENGDFSSAGAAQFKLVDSLAQGFAKVEVGEDNFYRFVAADTFRSGQTAATTLGFEGSYYDGPWENPENGRRFNGFARHAWTAGDTDFALTALGYHSEWDSTDQVAQRAIDSGLIGRFGTLNPTNGGDSNRASLSFDATRNGADSTTALNLYAIYYDLDLYSDFTYFLDDPFNGDQFNQRDERIIVGGALTHAWDSELAGRKTETKVGLQTRADFIDVGLFKTNQRARVSTVRDDYVQESSAGLFAETTLHVADWLRVQPGVRADAYYFDVDSDLAANSGTADDALVSPKLNVILGPWAKTEVYLNAGYGFHSNDARGTTITLDPSDGVTPVDPVDPLARSRGAEIGVRTAAVPGLVSTLSVWALELDSELLFVGDAGATEANGKTRRVGVEWANFYHVNEWLAFDADLAFTRARYAADAGGAPNIGRRIPGSIDTVLTGGAIITLPGGWFGTLRARYFGPQPLIEDNSVEAPSSITFNGAIGWKNRDWEIALSVLNLLDRDNNDIAYFYESQLATEGAPVADIHLHPAEPRTFRLAVTRRF